MTTHKVKYQEINEKLMQNFFKFLGGVGEDTAKIAFYLATQEGDGTYFDMLLEANIASHFLIFMGTENKNLLNKIFVEQSTPIRELLKLGLIKSDIELFKTY
jgi:hypothetical protein